MKDTLDIQVFDMFYTVKQIKTNQYQPDVIIGNMSMYVQSEVDSLTKLLTKTNKFGVPPSVSEFTSFVKRKTTLS